MKANTRLFGEVEIEDEKIITIQKGIIGFPELQHFTLIYDSSKEERPNIMWFQSLDEPQFAMPVMNPILVKPDYNPIVNDELLTPLGEMTQDNTFVLVTVKVPSDITKMSVNLKAPIIVNTDTLLGGQIIVEDDYPIRYEIYEVLKQAKEAGE